MRTKKAGTSRAPNQERGIESEDQVNEEFERRNLSLRVLASPLRDPLPYRWEVDLFDVGTESGRIGRRVDTIHTNDPVAAAKEFLRQHTPFPRPMKTCRVVYESALGPIGRIIDAASKSDARLKVGLGGSRVLSVELLKKR
jgi:hypothetical protein